MGLGFTISGLVLNIIGTICLACITPFLRDDKETGEIVMNFKDNAKKLYLIGLILISSGFFFQLLGVVLLHIK